MLLTILDAILVALGVVLLASLGFVLVTYAVAFWIAPRLEFPNKPETRHLAGQPPPPGVFGAACREVLNSFLLFSVYFYFPFYRGYARNAKPPGQLPVIFIPGYGMNRASWLFFLPMLARRGVRASMVAFQYNWLRCIEDSAAELAKTVDKVLTDHGASQVDLVAHSWGGNVARWYIQKLGMAGKVHQLVMVEVPNQGSFSTIYALGCPRTQLAVGSEVVKALAKAPEHPPLYLTWSKCDQVAVPWEFLMLPAGHGAKVVCREVLRIGHLSALLSPECADFVAGVLTGEIRQSAGK